MGTVLTVLYSLTPCFCLLLTHVVRHATVFSSELRPTVPHATGTALKDGEGPSLYRTTRKTHLPSALGPTN